MTSAHNGSAGATAPASGGGSPPIIVWFRRDLRLHDNPALQAAARNGAHILPVYIHAPDEERPWTPGSASHWWLHHSLAALDDALRAYGGQLVVRRGDSLRVLLELAEKTGSREIHWNRLYEPAAIERDGKIERALRDRGIEARSHNAALLFEPWTVSTRDDRPYRVFTPFWKNCLHLGLPREAGLRPDTLDLANAESLPLDSLGLLPEIPWDQGFGGHWSPGEAGALEALNDFLDDAAADYVDGRDHPARGCTSRLSPHLHFGELSPRRIVAAVREREALDDRSGLASSLEGFLRELGWREFSHHLLYHFPDTAQRSLDERFELVPWNSEHGDALEAWRRGRTGIPLIDAGMRELWHTGWMHNRVRMVTASFLTKNLLIPWQTGARWFWDTLVDADLANNTQGWQWTAGCGADAAPYFRVFNPVLQSRKFDPEGRYLRQWLPEIATLPDKALHAPWESPPQLLRGAGIRLGTDYPHPIVDLADSRKRALAAYETIKNA
ncbi:cryptochrome/photolyase family protein [Acidihalobacter prosperus]